MTERVKLTLGQLCETLEGIRKLAGDDARVEVSVPLQDHERVPGGAEKVILPITEVFANGSIMGTYVELIGTYDD